MERELPTLYDQALRWLRGPLTQQDLETARAKIQQTIESLRRSDAAEAVREIARSELAERARERAAESKRQIAGWLHERVRLRDTLHGAHLLVWVLAASSLSYCVFACSTGTISRIALAHTVVQVQPVLAGQPRLVAAPKPPMPAAGASLGMIEVPRLGLFAIVSQGDTPAILASAVGHVPESALPGEKGNSVLVGRYDTFLRGIEKTVLGDLVVFVGPQTSVYYRVESTKKGDAPRVAATFSASSGKSMLVLGTAPPAPHTRARGGKSSFTIVAREEKSQS